MAGPLGCVVKEGISTFKNSMTSVRFKIAFLGSLLYLETFFSFFLSPHPMAFKVHLQHGTSTFIRPNIPPGFHLKSRCFLKMCETTIALTKLSFYQNAESGKMIRDFFSSLGFSVLFKFSVLWFSPRRCPRSG